jgi:hypothetical protein
MINKDAVLFGSGRHLRFVTLTNLAFGILINLKINGLKPRITRKSAIIRI